MVLDLHTRVRKVLQKVARSGDAAEAIIWEERWRS